MTSASDLRPDQDLMFGATPQDPEQRQGVSFWISNDDPDQGLCFPRIGIEAIGREWDRPRHLFQAAWPDGRVLSAAGAEVREIPTDDRTDVLRAGPLTVRCVEPFRRWAVDYRGPAIDSTVGDQVGRRVNRDHTAPVEFHMEATMAVPAWIQGSLDSTARDELADGSRTADYMGTIGGIRFEQLFRGAGTLRIGSGSEDVFSCTGLRVFRQGARNTDGFAGHVWQSALFRSGRAFGYIAYPPGPDGLPGYAEGFTREPGADLMPVDVVEAPWMTRFTPHGGDVSFTLSSPSGVEHIRATTFASFVHRTVPGLDFPPVHQGVARYEWDGEVAYGMVERSYPDERITWS